MLVQDVLPLLQKSRKHRNGWVALCPAHDDRRPSLSVTEADGKVLLHCFAGCKYDEIICALKLLDGSTFGDFSASTRSDATRAAYKADTGRKKKGGHELAATYNYEDIDGKFLYQVLRFEKTNSDGSREKTFRVRRKDTSGKWIYKLGDLSAALYCLPELKCASEVYVVEGEKDVDTLLARGVVATCNPFGAGKWRDHFSDALKGKAVVIWPDNDEAGQHHSEVIAESLLQAGLRNVKIARIPRVPIKGDISDFFEAGGTVAELREIAGATSVWNPVRDVPAPNMKKRLLFTSLKDMLEEPDEEHAFIWEETLPTAGFSICSAKPKVGKSTFSRNLAAAIATGSDFLGRRTVKGRVLCLFLEEKRQEIKRHFRRMGVTSSDIFIHVGPAPSSLGELQDVIQEYRARFVIIDPLCRLLRVSDLNEYAAVAKAVEPFVDIARRTGAHLMALHHESKTDRSGGDALLGSSALYGSVDCNLRLRQQGQTRTLESIQRYGVDIEGMTLALNRETGIVTTDGELRDVFTSRLRNQILTVLETEEPLTGDEIKERISSFNNGAIAKALKDGVVSGVLSTTGSGKKKSPYLYSRTTVNC